MNDTNSKRKSWIQKLRHLFSNKPENKTQLIKALRDAEASDILDANALHMIEGVIGVTELHVRDIMIPRSHMVVVEQSMSPRDCLPILIDSQHSRFPVIGETRDEIAGILLAKDLLRFILGEEENFSIKDIFRPAIFVPESKRLDTLLREFRLSRQHMAIVVDEYGGIAGLITIEDVLEQIVGEIEDEYDIDEEQHNIKPLNPRQYIIKALTPIEDFNHYFHTNFSDEEFDTIGGLIMNQFGHLPQRGETTMLHNFDFKVLQADDRRLQLLRMTIRKKQ